MEKRRYLSKNNTRIDQYLAHENPGVPRRFFQNAIKEKKILVNNQPVKPSYELQENDQIEISIDIPKKIGTNKIEPNKKIPLEIIFQNQDFLVLNKQPGISVHPSENGNENDTIVNGLLEKFPEISGVGEDPLRPGIVHRLDKETSGLMLAALNQKSYQHFKNFFQDRKIRKTYLTVAWGVFGEKSGEIKNFIGKSNKNPNKQATSRQPQKLINPKEAWTCYEVLKEKNDMSLLEINLKTGRKHQIRVHLHSIGHPVAGDQKYFLKKFQEKNRDCDNLMLHAHKLEFSGPDGKNHSFTSPPPDHFPLKQ